MLTQVRSVVLVFAAFAPTLAAADDDRRVSIRWTFAGSFIQNIARVGPPPAPFVAIVGRTSIIHVEARGAPGRATIRVSGGGGTPLPSPPPDFPPPILSTDPCEGLTKIPFGGENSFVATLHEDLSLLWGARDATPELSYVCSDPATGLSHGVVFVVFLGGTGRLEGARGRGVIVFHARPVIPGSSFSIDTGSLRGTLRVGNPD